ncbi:DUF2863 family protein [Rugamonas sp. DEMB1]|uniref:DUF2863 family protein n=1 Tax=Rugamonas sp. DEMB1 TaxID=3039386 RepID=UPI0024478ACD|nr:DUF2863 family protein [Rugamonas sp. DEMB1]WGG51102.1 DUF2863 family protein [Rugamonas sp. DEMB1]
MPKNKRPAPRKSADSPEEKNEQHAHTLCQLALELAEREDGEALDAQLREQEQEFHKLVRKLVNQHKDEALYGAVELARDEDIGAYQLLRETIEEAAATVLLRRDGAPTLEVNAFAIPLFVHSDGGLDMARDFQDADAFEALVASFTSAGLEAPKAKVVLMRHAYDAEEFDRITYGELNAMVREAAATMSEKKLLPAPALERSLSGWSPSAFGPADRAVELRFLLGFALKRADEPFYQVPADEDAADAHFAARARRYQQWTALAAPLLQRCMGQQQALDFNFLYQDLFFGAKEQGLAEHATLRLLAALNQALQAAGAAPAQCRAVLGPAGPDQRLALRVLLLGADGATLADGELPLELGADLEGAVDDAADALASIGVTQLSLTPGFDAQGRPQELRALS